MDGNVGHNATSGLWNHTTASMPASMNQLKKLVYTLQTTVPISVELKIGITRNFRILTLIEAQKTILPNKSTVLNRNLVVHYKGKFMAAM